MRFNAPPISHTRLSRFARWAGLWLTWFAAFLDAAAAFAPLSAPAERIAWRWLDQVERLIVSVAALRAVARVRVLRKRHGFSGCGRLCTRGFWRAIVGARLRRKFRSSDMRVSIASLRMGVDALAARILKRLPRGFTRRRPILARREARAPAPAAHAFAPLAAADTS